MAIFKLLDESPIVAHYEVLDFKIWKTGSYIKLKVGFKNRSVLYMREYSDDKERNYSFHWQDAIEKLIIRWDNAPHHTSIPTFPHHKHVGDTVEPSTETTPEDVLQRIEKIQTSKRSNGV